MATLKQKINQAYQAFIETGNEANREKLFGYLHEMALRQTKRVGFKGENAEDAASEALLNILGDWDAYRPMDGFTFCDWARKVA